MNTEQAAIALTVAFSIGVLCAYTFQPKAEAHPCDAYEDPNCRYVEQTDSVGGKFMVWQCD